MTDDVYSITTEAERKLLSELAREVPRGGTILEIGALYGGTTAVLALANPSAKVFSIDNFSWTPEGYPRASKDRFENNMKSIGANNVIAIEGDSKVLISHWERNIDLLWIDGGHDFSNVYSDLYNYSRHSKVIALHDYKNPMWPTVEKAIEIFLRKYEDTWYFSENVEMVAVLRKRNIK
jgi:precorrin-6B methylase 2